MIRNLDTPLVLEDISFKQEESKLSIKLPKNSALKLATLLEDPTLAIVSSKNKLNATDVTAILGISIHELEDSGITFDDNGDVSREELYKELGL